MEILYFVWAVGWSIDKIYFNNFKIYVNVKAVELSYVPLYHAVYSLYGAFFGIFHTLMSIFSVR